MKNFPCDICSSTAAVEAPFVRLYTNEQPLHICKTCGLVYVQKRRSSEEIAKTWSEELYGSHYVTRIPAVLARQVYVAEFLNKHLPVKNKSICDIGAGEGQFLELLRDQYGANVFGIEPSVGNCTLLKNNGFNCFQGTIEEFMEPGIANEKFDIATVIWTLENCMSSQFMLKAAHSVLKEKGLILIATGSRILVPYRKTLNEYLGPHPIDTHPARFSANTLRALLARSGFEPVAINRYFDTDYLCVIAQKVEQPPDPSVWYDNFLEVYDFFAKWHDMTMCFIKSKRD